MMVLAFTFMALTQNLHVDARVSAFIPSNKMMRQIYGDCQANYEVEVGRFIYPKYELWGNLSCFNSNGKTQSLGSQTQFTNANLSCGAKYLFRLNRFLRFYLGGGINGAYVYVFDDSPCNRHDHKGGIGGVLKLGAYFKPKNHLFFELYTDYLYQKIDFDQNVQIGGVRIGAGAGWMF